MSQSKTSHVQGISAYSWWQPACPSGWSANAALSHAASIAHEREEQSLTQLLNRFIVFAVAVMCLAASARPAHAQSESRLVPAEALVGQALNASACDTTVAPQASAPTRSLVLPALQVSFAALQVMDVVSTTRALNAGLVEGNAAMRGIVDKPIALAAIKGGAAVATILITNRVARKNRAAAIATMIAVNTAYSVVVARNLQAAGR